MNTDQPIGQTDFAVPLNLDAAPRQEPLEGDVFRVRCSYAEFRKSLAGNNMFFLQLEVIEGLRSGVAYAGDRIKVYMVLPDPVYDVDGNRIQRTEKEQSAQAGRARRVKDTLIALGHPRLEVRERFCGVNPDPVSTSDLRDREAYVEYEPKSGGPKSYSSTSFKDPNVAQSQFESAVGRRQDRDPLGKTASV